MKIFNFHLMPYCDVALGAIGRHGTMPHDMVRADMEAIAPEILPAFRDRLPQGKSTAAAAE